MVLHQEPDRGAIPDVHRGKAGEEGKLVMGSDLALTRAKLKEALERVELIHQAMTVDPPRIAEVSFLRF